jgi:DNA modification methylase
MANTLGNMPGAHRAETVPTHIRDLVPDPANRRAHNPRNIGMVVDALQQVGAARSIVIDEDNVILAGNGVTEAAAEAGITKVRVIEATGDELIAVRRSGLTDEQKRALAIFDNRTGELATWDLEQLALDQGAGLSLQPFWTPEEEAALLAKKVVRGGKTDPGDVPPERSTGIQPGDLFQLGAHRLLCGDATAPTDVTRLLGPDVPPLMVTDPPYGVDYDPTWRAAAGINRNAGKLGRVANDDRADWRAAWALFPGHVVYVWHAGLKGDIVHASLVQEGFLPRAQIIWAKDRMALSRGDYHWQHEPCLYAVREGAAAHRTDDRTQTTLWTIPAREDHGHGHGTQKPVECMRRPMQNHALTDVYEPFCGSGTTIIAAEQLGRRCLAIELEPRYVQVAIDRWEAFTGKKAAQVGARVPRDASVTLEEPGRYTPTKEPSS